MKDNNQAVFEYLGQDLKKRTISRDTIKLRLGGKVLEFGYLTVPQVR